MEPFPSSLTRALPPVKREKVYLYCICRMPEGDGKMALCPKCKEWYHQLCDNIPDFIFENKRSKYNMPQMLLTRHFASSMHIV